MNASYLLVTFITTSGICGSIGLSLLDFSIIAVFA
jgi:hypothetical protein